MNFKSKINLNITIIIIFNNLQILSLILIFNQFIKADSIELKKRIMGLILKILKIII